MEIIRGIQYEALKIVVYGPEGIGKSTFASKFPDPVFIDTEGSTKSMDVSRTPPPTSWAMLKEQLQYFRQNPHFCNTVIVDTMDWAERLCKIDLCGRLKIGSMEEMPYGKAYTYLAEEIGRALDVMTDIVKAGTNVVLTCHARMRKFEQPDELGAYDRWELKLEKLVAAMVKEWADIILFANYKTSVVNVDGQGVQKGKNKVQGGKRVMYASHHPCWDAKNRHDLPDEMPFDFEAIAHLFFYREPPEGKTEPEAKAELKSDIEPGAPAPKPTSTTASETPTPSEPETTGEQSSFKEMPDNAPAKGDGWEGIPRKVADLLRAADIEPYEVEKACSVTKDYMPRGMHIKDYPMDFIDGCIVGAWDQLKAIILSDPDRVPFK